MQNTPHATHHTTPRAWSLSIAEVASRFNLKPVHSKGKLEYIGPNPFELGAKENGFAIAAEGDYKGVGYDRKLGRTYPSRRIAEFCGVEYQDYEGFESDPAYNRETLSDTGNWDNRSLEERGLSRGASENFLISSPLGVHSDWGEYREFATFHPDGSPGRKRIKYRFPQNQLKTNPNKDPAKTIWHNPTKHLGQPVAYNLNMIRDGDVVWVVNSELAVWLFWQEGLTAICPFGESRKAETWKEIFAIIQTKGAERICVVLDNDSAGRAGTVKACKAARDLELRFEVYDLSLHEKKGFDAGDLWEFWRDSTLPDGSGEALLGDVPFEEFLEAQPRASQNVIEGWAKLTQLEKKQKESEQANAILDNIGRTAIKGREIKHAKFGDATFILEMLAVNQVFYTPEGARCVIIETKEAGGKVRRETYDILDKEFEEYVYFTYLAATGQVPTDSSVKGALKGLAAKARGEGICKPSFVRTGYLGEDIYIDLCNEAREVVRLNRSGWEVITDCPVDFRRPKTLLPLPTPMRNSDNERVWNDFRSIINYGTDENFTLVQAWMVSALVPGRWPCPILCVNGAMGSAKTALCRLVRRTVDPAETDLIPPEVKDAENLIATVKSARVLGIDNLQEVPKWLSNFISAMVTGTAYSVRTLYTNFGNDYYKAKVAMVINGIPEKIGQADMQDRMIRLFLPAIASKGPGYALSDSEVDAAHEKLHPHLLGAILDAMVVGAANWYENGKIEALLEGRYRPRMADFTNWSLCCEEAFRVSGAQFYDAYIDNIQAVAASESDGFLNKAVEEFVDSQPGCEWTGRTGELWLEMKKFCAYKFADQRSMELVSRNHLISELQKEASLAEYLDKGEEKMMRAKAFPSAPAGFATALTSIGSTLAKARGITCERVSQNSRGSTWVLKRFRAPEDALTGGLSLVEPRILGDGLYEEDE